MKRRLKTVVLLMAVLLVAVSSCKEEDELTLQEAARNYAKASPKFGVEVEKSGVNSVQLSVSIERRDETRTVECPRVGVLVNEITDSRNRYSDYLYMKRMSPEYESKGFVEAHTDWDWSLLGNKRQTERFEVKSLRPDREYFAMGYVYYRLNPMEDWVLEYTDTVAFRTKEWRIEIGEMPTELRVSQDWGVRYQEGTEWKYKGGWCDTLKIDLSTVKLVDADGEEAKFDDNRWSRASLRTLYNNNIKNPKEHYSESYEFDSSPDGVSYWGETIYEGNEWRETGYLTLVEGHLPPDVIRYRIEVRDDNGGYYYSEVKYIKVVKI
ncbi:MAG: hypothetical protein II951_13665 [Bacteroidales bacterium]|nr:hypothetical protein [Bacteroidales bacterium]